MTPSIQSTIREASDRDKESWNAFLSSTATPPMCRYEWRFVLEESYRTSTRFLLAERSGHVVGILPLYLVRRWTGFRQLYSLQHGLLSVDAATARALADSALEIARSESCSEVLITSGFRDFDLPKSTFDKRSFTLQISRSEAENWKNLRGKTRNMVRRAQKSGLRVENDPSMLGPFFDIYADRMIRKGVSIHSLCFFENMRRAFGEDFIMLCAYRDNDLVGGLIVVAGPKASTYPFQASQDSATIFAPNSLLVWHAITICAERGNELLEMGEARPGGNVYSFKKNFGGTPRQVTYKSLDSTTRSVKEKYEGLARRAENAIRRIAPSPFVRRLAVSERRQGRII